MLSSPTLAIFRRSKLAFAALPIAALGFVIGHTVISNAIPAWAIATQAAIQPIAVCGPLLAAFSAWSAADFGRTTMRSRLRLSLESGFRAVFLVWASNIVWALLCYALWLAALFSLMATGHTWGAPTWSWLASGAASIAAQVGLGTALGFVWPTVLAPALTAVTTFTINGALVILQVLPNQSLLSGGFTQTQQVTFAINETILWSQALWFVGLGIVGLAIIALTQRWREPKAIALVLLGIATSAAGFSSVTGSAIGFFNYTHSGWTYICNGQPQVCLHPALETNRENIASALQPMLTHLNGTPFGSTRYELTNRGYLGEPSHGSRAFHIDRFDEGWDTRVRLELARDLLTAGSASGGPCDGDSDSNEAGAFAGLKSIIVAWLAEVPDAAIAFSNEEKTAHQRFIKRNETEKKTWLINNVSKICESRLQPMDF